MQKISIQKKVFISLLVASTFVVSGCNHASTPTPVAKTKAQLKHSFGTEHITTAVTNAAKENGWQVVQSPSSESLVLKKTFSKKETAKNTRGRTWNKVRVNKEIYANVAITPNSYEIDLTKDSKAFFSSSADMKKLQKDLHKLDNSISLELVHDIL